MWEIDVGDCLAAAMNTLSELNIQVYKYYLHWAQSPDKAAFWGYLDP